eukprot:m.306842 g.306842  ORF g.306842 m.306842 type:complete len:67 (+) comp27369_c0_seq8:960-1160(+)
MRLSTGSLALVSRCDQLAQPRDPSFIHDVVLTLSYHGTKMYPKLAASTLIALHPQGAVRNFSTNAH